VQSVVQEATVNQRTAFYVDIYNPILNGGGAALIYDGAIHPNQYGHAEMARVTYQRFIAATNMQGFGFR
jgi:hypothetical protein